MAIPVIVHCSQILRYVLINVKYQLFLFWIHSRQVVKWNVYHISENSICFWKQAQFVLKDLKRLDHLVFFCRTVIRSCDEISTNDITALKFQQVCCHYKVEIWSNCGVVQSYLRRYDKRKRDGLGKSMNNKCAGWRMWW